MRGGEVLNYNSTCTFSYKNSPAAREATALLYATKLVIVANSAGSFGATKTKTAPKGTRFEIPLRSIEGIFDSPPGSFVIRSTRGSMKCLYLDTSGATELAPEGPWVLCFSTTNLRLRWSSELRFARSLLRSLDAHDFRQGHLTPQIAPSFLLPPVGISTGRPFFAATNNTICLETRAECLTSNAPNGTLTLAPLAWANGFPAIRAIPPQRWQLYPTVGDADGVQICQPNVEAATSQDLCLAAMRSPSDDFTGLPIETPESVRGQTAREQREKLDEWRVFTSCDGGDYRCFVLSEQRIGKNSTLNDARVCQRACMLDPACDGWTHTLAGVGNMKQGRCCLKKREDPSEPLACVNDECCTSGLKPRPVINKPKNAASMRPEIDKSLDAVGVKLTLAPRNSSSTKRWQLEEGGESGAAVSRGVRIVFVNAEPLEGSGDQPLPGEDVPLCLTLSVPAGAKGAHVGLLPCLDEVDPLDPLAMELLHRQTWTAPLPKE